jgi:hypothetical protein
MAGRNEEGSRMGKLQNTVGCGTCASIIPARGNVDPTTARRHEEEQLEQRIEEEAGEVKKRKCTPIEYLLLFGKVPEIDQVQVMTMDDLTADDARQLLEAGCSKRFLMQLYGIKVPGGPHYRQLAELLGGEELVVIKDETTKKTESVPEKGMNITWLAPTIGKSGKSRITINKHNAMRINAVATATAPCQYRQGCKARVGVDKKQGILAIQPVKIGEDGYLFRSDLRALISDQQMKNLGLIATSRQAREYIQAAGMPIPAKFDASWDDDLQAWVGQLVEEEI